VTRIVCNLTVVENAAALAQVLAACVVDSARAAIALHDSCSIALAGGTTPKAAYALLATPPLRDALDWSKLRFFFGDERCVAPDDSQSNYKMAYDTLLGPLGIPPGRIFRMRGEDEPAKAARDYAAVLRHELGDEPALDMMLLGMGPDGHTASLFPGSDPLEDDARLVRAPYVAKLSAYRITVTPRVINNAQLVAIATAGTEKAAALAAALEGPRDPVRYPVQVVAAVRGRLVWLVDRAAASSLKKT
jgi:6-phosphogluconolactonase